MTKAALKKGRLSGRLQSRLVEYYGSLEGLGPGYVEKRWQAWKADPHLITYVAKKGEEPLAWVLYNPRSSMIEEIIAAREPEADKVLPEAIDGLIARESLVAAELPGQDREKYRRLIAYGFRPTRSFSAHGLPFLKMDLSTAVFFERIKGSPPPRPYRRKETVAIERVPASRTHEEIKESLARLFRKLGGMKRFVKPGEKVVLKPNIVADHGMKDGVYQGGIVTDIRLVRALIELLLPVAGKIIVAEGSSINRSETGKMFAHYGYDRLVEIDRGKVSVVDLNTDRLVEKQVPSGKRMTSRKVPRTIAEADALISLPVLKIHFAAIASLAIKNLQGAMPPLEKYMTHFFGLWQNLVNIHLLIKPRLTIVDGLTGQEGFGPVSGTPKEMNLLIAGKNPVAVDAVAMRVMGLEPASSPPVFLAYLQGLGPIEPGLIHVVGEPIEKVARPFMQPEINLQAGRNFFIHGDGACPGCRGYLHYVLAKLRRPDPKNPGNLLIDRPFDPPVHIFLGPSASSPDPNGTTIFMGMCQQHQAGLGSHMAGCPPHAEVIMNAIFRLFPDVERPKYADETEEAKLEKMLNQVLAAKG